MKTKSIKNITILFILLIMLSIGFTIPHASSAAPISVNIDQAISFQNEGTTLTYDDTTKIRFDDGDYGPTPIGEVIENYYACGTSVLWFDAISIHFDLSGIGSLEDYSLQLIIDLQKGDYQNNDWQYYMILQGDKNPTNEDTSAGAFDFAETKVPDGTIIRLEVPVEASMFVDGWITIRLWNARVDYVELELTSIEETIDGLIEDVESLGLPLDFILTNPLERAIKFINRPKVSIANINVFIRRCGIYYRIFNQLNEAEYNQLITLAEEIKSEL
jgi:hypothetical protein